jgi:hypothetical protein
VPPREAPGRAGRLKFTLTGPHMLAKTVIDRHYGPSRDIEQLPRARILDGAFTAVQQAVGTARQNAAGAAFLRDFVEEAKSSGLIARHRVRGLSVAPPD